MNFPANMLEDKGPYLVVDRSELAEWLGIDQAESGERSDFDRLVELEPYASLIPFGRDRLGLALSYPSYVVGIHPQTGGCMIVCHHGSNAQGERVLSEQIDSLDDPRGARPCRGPAGRAN